MQVISIQSQVIYGHVGNSAAVFPMQAHGIDVVAVPTTLLSNHPHYSTMHGRILEPDLVAGLLRGVEERRLIETSDVIITGFMGSVENARVVADFVSRALQINPEIIYVCDPVIGDYDLGTFVEEGLIDFFKERLTPIAAVITPNQYELEILSSGDVGTLEEIIESAKILQERGTGSVIATGCMLADTPVDTLETVLCEESYHTRFSCRRLPIRPYGTGDLFTALLVSRLCQKWKLSEACAKATLDTFAILNRTAEAGNPSEMSIIGFPFSIPASAPS